MASHHDPLLSSRTPTATYRALWLITSITIILTLVTLAAFDKLPLLQSPNSQPAQLCTESPNPASCHSIVSDALLLSGRRSTPSTILRTILLKSLSTLSSAASVATDLHHHVSDVRQKTALADCLHLMDLSRDRLTRAAGANARTYLSAVLTNHETCLDGLDGPARTAMEGELASLTALTSASLAVLNSVERSAAAAAAAAAAREAINIRFPSWVSPSDKKLLEMTPGSARTAVKANVVVAKDGSGKYKTVQEAVNSAPDKGSSRYVIYVKKGVYKENVSIGKKKTNVMVVGDGMDATVITGSLNYVDGTTTFQSATLAAVGDDLILQDLKIENTAGAIKHQAVALRVGADRSVINRCKIEAYQDTLYAHSLRQFYRDSTVSGTIDFIFGNAAVVLQNCNLVARKPMSNQQNLVTAQGRTDPNQNTGTSVQNCQVIPSPELKPVTNSIPSYLGRPWKEYSRTVFMQSYIDRHIDPKGWKEWDGNFALNTLFYGEYQNRGPGAGTGGRVNWRGYKVITDVKTAQSFTVAGLIQGGSWLKSTGVTFTEGL